MSAADSARASPSTSRSRAAAREVSSLGAACALASARGCWWRVGRGGGVRVGGTSPGRLETGPLLSRGAGRLYRLARLCLAQSEVACWLPSVRGCSSRSASGAPLPLLAGCGCTLGDPVGPPPVDGLRASSEPGEDSNARAGSPDATAGPV